MAGGQGAACQAGVGSGFQHSTSGDLPVGARPPFRDNVTYTLVMTPPLSPLPSCRDSVTYTLIITNTTFEDNTSFNSVGGGVGAGGGALALEGYNHTVLQLSTFSGNIADNGDGGAILALNVCVIPPLMHACYCPERARATALRACMLQL